MCNPVMNLWEELGNEPTGHKSHSHLDHDNITDVICHTLVLTPLTAMKTWTCTVSGAVTPPLPREQIKWFCRLNRDTFHWAGQHEPPVWESSSVTTGNTNTEGVGKHISLSIINLHGHKNRFWIWLTLYGLQVQDSWVDGQMKPKQHWSRTTSPVRQKTESREQETLSYTWHKLGSQGRSGKPCSCETNSAVSHSNCYCAFRLKTAAFKNKQKNGGS